MTINKTETNLEFQPGVDKQYALIVVFLYVLCV